MDKLVVLELDQLLIHAPKGCGYGTSQSLLLIKMDRHTRCSLLILKALEPSMKTKIMILESSCLHCSWVVTSSTIQWVPLMKMLFRTCLWSLICRSNCKYKVRKQKTLTQTPWVNTFPHSSGLSETSHSVSKINIKTRYHPSNTLRMHSKNRKEHPMQLSKRTRSED